MIFLNNLRGKGIQVWAFKITNFSHRMQKVKENTEKTIYLKMLLIAEWKKIEKNIFLKKIKIKPPLLDSTEVVENMYGNHYPKKN